MRTTVSIDDDLLRDLKKRAAREKSSLTKMVNLYLRKGIAAAQIRTKSATAYRERTFDMGVPLIDLTKALSIAAQLEDEEILRKMALGK